MHRHHKRALACLAAAAASDVAFGTAFALASRVSIPDGLWFATVTGTTVGYGDITPRGWLPHLIATGALLTIIPLFAAAFSFLTSGLASADTREHVDARLAEHAEDVGRRLGEHASQVRAHVDRALAGRPSADADDEEGAAQ